MSVYQSHLFDFAYFPKYDECIQDLAENLAMEEIWDFSDTTIKKYVILKNYLEHTFRKLVEERKVVYTPNNQYACFNTGLVTSNLEDIFAFFEKHKGNNPQSPYFFKGFLKKSHRAIIYNFISNLPEVANYFKTPELLIYNPNYEIIPDYDHIITDNKDRFPSHLRSANDETIRRHLIGAIDEAKKTIRINYKIAVPQYYKGKIQLLIPLRLTDESANPDLALVLTKRGKDKYTARTCLTLKMAYQNARLIVRPQSEWLKP